MSAVGGRADVACQELSGPFLAISGHCDTIGWEPSTALNSEIQPSHLRRGLEPQSDTFAYERQTCCFPEVCDETITRAADAEVATPSSVF
jgi:hypothetical protein